MQPKYNAVYRALVTSNTDPAGNIRVQCPQISGLAEIRSAEPANPQMPLPLVGSTVWLAFSGGDITKPVYFANTSYINAVSNTSLHMQSLISGANNDAAQLFIASGADGVMTGSGSAPHITLRDGNGTTPVDLRISGSAVKVTTAGSLYVWQTPAYDTNWAGSSTFNGSSNWGTLQYRFDTEDNVWFIGAFKTTAAASNPVFTLPIAYRPVNQWAIPCQQNDSGVLSYISLEVGSSGNVNILSNVGGSTTAGNEYLVNGIFPLGNLS